MTLLFLDIYLFFQVIYFQKLFILRGKSHWRGIAGTKKPSLGGLLVKCDLRGVLDHAAFFKLSAEVDNCAFRREISLAQPSILPSSSNILLKSYSFDMFTSSRWGIINILYIRFFI